MTNEKTQDQAKANTSEAAENERKRKEMLIALAELNGDQLLLDAARGDAEAMAKYERRVEGQFAESARKLTEEVRANPGKWAEKIANAGAGLVRASVLQQMGAKLSIAVLRKTIREASLVCAALERMGHEAHPFGWSDPEKNASMEGLLFDVIDADEANIMRFESNELPSAVVAARLAMRSDINDHQALNRWVVLRDLRTHLRHHAETVNGVTSASDPTPESPLTTRLLHDDFALTLEEQTCILDALGCIDRQTNALGAEHAVRDDVETILEHIDGLQRDAMRWQESQRPEGTGARDVADEALDKARERGLGRSPRVTTPLGRALDVTTSLGRALDEAHQRPAKINVLVCRVSQELAHLAAYNLTEAFPMVRFRPWWPGVSVVGETIDGVDAIGVDVPDDVLSRCIVASGSGAEAIAVLARHERLQEREPAADPAPKDSIPKRAIQAGDTVRIKGTSYPDERVFAVGRVDDTSSGIEALLVWTDAHDVVGTKTVPVAALEVVEVVS